MISQWSIGVNSRRSAVDGKRIHHEDTKGTKGRPRSAVASTALSAGADPATGTAGYLNGRHPALQKDQLCGPKFAVGALLVCAAATWLVLVAAGRADFEPNGHHQ